MLYADLFWSLFYTMSQSDALYMSPQSIFYSHSFLVYVLCVPHCPHCFCKCDQCYQAFSTVMTLKKHEKKEHVFVCVFYSVCRRVPTVLYASLVFGPQLPIWHQIPINCIPMYILNRADECIQYILNRADEWTISIVLSGTFSLYSDIQSQLCWCTHSQYQKHLKWKRRRKHNYYNF